MCTSCKVQINGKGGQFSVAEGGQFYIAANNTDAFVNIQTIDHYWSQTAHDAGSAWWFDLSGGWQSYQSKATLEHAWAVRDGDVVIPDPSPYARCQDYVDRHTGLSDGEYLITNQGRTFQVYCAEMWGVPREYLTLHESNFSQYTTGGARSGTNVRTVYSKVRLDVDTLTVDTSDQTFSHSSGSLVHGVPATSMPYAVAMDCRTTGSSAGVAKIDLRGTQFKVTDTFDNIGFNPGPGAPNHAQFSAGDQVVDLAGGGFCGWTDPSPSTYNPINNRGGPKLNLGYIPVNLTPDSDGDGIGDFAEFDDDDDGIADVVEEAIAGLDPLNDADGGGDLDLDGVTNIREIRSGSDPNDLTSVPGAGYISFTYQEIVFEESDGVIPVEVRRLRGDAGTVSVLFETSDGTAQAGTNYETVTQTLVWNDGDVAPKLIDVPLIESPEPGGGSIFNMNLSNPTGGAQIMVAHRIAIILENDLEYSGIDFGGIIAGSSFDVRVSEAEGQATLYVDRRYSTSGAVSVDYALLPINATAGVDYRPIAGTLHWSDGDSAPKPIVVTILDDADIEQSEHMELHLSNPTGNTFVTQYTPRLFILDEEMMQLPSAVGNVSRTPRAEETDPATLRFVRTGDGVGEVTVGLDFFAGFNRAATPGVDYDDTPTSVTWADGETGVKEVEIPVFDDILLDGPAVFEVIGVGRTFPAGVFNAEPWGLYPLIFDFEDIDSTTDRDGDGTADRFDIDDNNNLILDWLEGNSPPYAIAELFFTTTENVVLHGVIDVTTTAIDPDNDALLVRTAGTPAHGDLTGLNGNLLVDGEFDFIPQTGYVGPASFHYYLCDIAVCTGPFVVHVEIEPAPLQFASPIPDVVAVEDGADLLVDIVSSFGAPYLSVELVDFTNPSLFDSVQIDADQVKITLAADQNGVADVTVAVVGAPSGLRAFDTFRVSVHPSTTAPPPESPPQ